MLSPFPNSSVGFMRGGGAVMPGMIGFQIGTQPAIEAPPPQGGGSTGGDVNFRGRVGPRDFEELEELRRKNRILREDEELLEIISIIVASDLLE